MRRTEKQSPKLENSFEGGLQFFFPKIYTRSTHKIQNLYIGKNLGGGFLDPWTTSPATGLKQTQLFYLVIIYYENCILIVVLVCVFKCLVE